jgi:hypothetical protein
MRLLPRQFSTGFKNRKIFLQVFQKNRAPLQKRVENFSVLSFAESEGGSSSV